MFFRSVSIISQTTQAIYNFLDVAKAILDKRPKELKVINTICKDVEERQEAARSLARKVDTVLVVGGRNSANTRRLFEICKRISKKTYLLETENDINYDWFDFGETVGIVSGASTPDWIVKKVVDKISVNSKRKGLCD